jgi:hypothetical protein
VTRNSAAWQSSSARRSEIERLQIEPWGNLSKTIPALGKPGSAQPLISAGLLSITIRRSLRAIRRSDNRGNSLAPGTPFPQFPLRYPRSSATQPFPKIARPCEQLDRILHYLGRKGKRKSEAPYTKYGSFPLSASEDASHRDVNVRSFRSEQVSHINLPSRLFLSRRPWVQNRGNSNARMLYLCELVVKKSE